MSTTEARVMTVLGPVAPETLGMTDAHSHLYIKAVPGAADDAPALTDEAAVADELAQFRHAGGDAIVDCQPGTGCGRDGRALVRLSRATGVHVVAATGFHRRRYYGPDAPLFKMPAEAAATQFRNEITYGLVETRDSEHVAYPGHIKTAAEATLAETPPVLLEAAALVARETGYSIEIHTERGAAVIDLLQQLVAYGVEPQQLVFCHVDKRPDFALHQELAAAGALLEYDTFFRPKYEPDKYVWPLISQMVAAGYERSLALATDMAEPSLWAELGGGPGLIGWFTIIRPRLAALGLSTEQINLVTGQNIAERLAVAPVGVKGA